MARIKKQPALPSMEQKTCEPVDAAAEAYQEIRESLVSLKRQLDAAHDALLLQMEKHGVEVYVDKTAVPPLEVRLDRKVKAKVKKQVEKKSRRSRKSFL